MLAELNDGGDVITDFGWGKDAQETLCNQLIDVALLCRQIGRGGLVGGNDGVVIGQLCAVHISFG